jgi:putative ABC transport system permease protein
MHSTTILRECLRALARNWMRSVLTVLGIGCGVAAFICVVAIGNAGTAKVERQMQDLGDNFIWIEAGARTRNGVRAGSRGSRTLVMNDMYAVQRQVPLIRSITPNVDGHVQIVYGNNNWNTTYRGVTPDFLQIRRWDIRLGNFFTDEDVTNQALVCVIGQTVVDNLFGEEDPIDKTMRVKDLPCKVVGVFARKGISATGQDQDDLLAMPFTTVQKRITGTFWLDDIFCSAVSREAMPLATQQIIGLLRERHHLKATEDDDFNIRQPEDIINAQLAASRILTFLLASVASLSLLVGGIGIMNIMLVSVTQRTREIGVRLAVGATDWDVQVQFLAEAAVLGGLGGVLGLFLGILSTAAVQSMFQTPAQLSTAILITGCFFSIAVGLLFGFYPARKASRLDPIQALRYE